MTTMSDSPLWILGFEFEAEDANARDIAAMGYGVAYRWEGTSAKRRTAVPFLC